MTVLGTVAERFKTIAELYDLKLHRILYWYDIAKRLNEAEEKQINQSKKSRGKRK